MLPGMPVHITHRGNDRQRCFYEECDQAFYLFHLRRLLPHTQCALHAYCLMTNHVHLLLTPATVDSCARLMKGLAQRHTQYVNRTYRRTGTLWEGRFHSCLVQSEDYLLTCYRYVELNPVEAGLCEHPDEYEWSSCRTNAHGIFGAVVTPHEEYLRLGGTADSRQAAYRELLAAPLSRESRDEIDSATNGNFALGDEKFKQAVSKALGRRAYPGAPGRPSQPVTCEDDQGDLLKRQENVVCP
jgi:putative transposase